MSNVAADVRRRTAENPPSPHVGGYIPASIRTETENSIKTVFGDKAFQSYQNQPGAYWLKSINPDKKSTTP